MSFGTRLTQTRKAKGLTQDQLGKGLGTDGKDVGKAVVYGWEKDQHAPRADQLRMICERLDCSADYLLLGRTGIAAPSEFSALAEEAEHLSPKWREWVLMTLREAVKLALEADQESHVTQKSDPKPSPSPRRKAA